MTSIHGRPRSMAGRLRGAHGRTERLGGTRPVRRRLPPRGGLPGRRDAVRLGPAATIWSCLRHGPGDPRAGAPQALQYGSGQGIPELREHILDVMALEGIAAKRRRRRGDDRFTARPRTGLASFSSTRGTWCSPRRPSYVTALVILPVVIRRRCARHDGCYGLIPDALRENIARARAHGRRIKFLYTVPTFHNPAGVTLTWERRLEILEIAREQRHPGPRGQPVRAPLLRRQPPPAMRSVEEDGVIYLGTFSKTLAPGFRVGWALAPHAIRENSSWRMRPPCCRPRSFSQLVITEYLATRRLARPDRHLPRCLPGAPGCHARRTRRTPSRAHAGRCRTAASTSGSPCPTSSTRRRCCRARSPSLSPTRPAPRSTPTERASDMRLSFCYPTPRVHPRGRPPARPVIEAEFELLERTGPIPGGRPPSSRWTGRRRTWP